MLLHRYLITTVPFLLLIWTSSTNADGTCKPKLTNSTPTSNSSSTPTSSDSTPTTSGDSSTPSEVIVTSVVTSTVTVQPPSPTGTASNNTRRTGDNNSVARTWYTGWHAQHLSIDDIDWDKFNSVSYAFAIPQKDGSIALQDSDVTLLNALVPAAHDHNATVTISVGGWTGSLYFSPIMADNSTRALFLNATLDLINKYNVDGIDIDWEYVNDVKGAGLGCNVRATTDDKANLYQFLQELRSTDIGQNITVTAAVTITPFNDQTGVPSTNVSEFANVLDYIEIMAYDILVPTVSDVAGPHSPLDDSCTPKPYGSAMSAVKAWTGANFPADKIVLGVPSYGRSFFVNISDAVTENGTLNMYVPNAQKQAPVGDVWDTQLNATSLDPCNNTDVPSGVWNYVNLHAQGSGFLSDNDAALNNAIAWNDTGCTKSSLLYVNSTSGDSMGTMIYYDSEDTFTAKGNYIKSAGLRGFAMWEAAGDYGNRLLNAITQGMS